MAKKTNLCRCGAIITGPYNQWKGECKHCENLREAEAFVVGDQRVTAQLENGWIEWGGGECPVEPDTELEARCLARLGKHLTQIIVTGPARQLSWERKLCSQPAVVLAYRIVP